MEFELLKAHGEERTGTGTGTGDENTKWEGSRGEAKRKNMSCT
jgi:hypothetical protein